MVERREALVQAWLDGRARSPPACLDLDLVAARTEVLKRKLQAPLSKEALDQVCTQRA